jgi:hypothetical protein
MQMNLSLLFLFNYFINSFLVFFTCILILEILLYCLKIKDFRVRYFLRFLPLLKLFFDFLNYGFSSWALAFHINPVLLEKGSRTFSVALGFESFPFLNIFFCLNDGKTFSLADILANYLNPKIFYFLVGIFLTGTFLGILKFFKSLKRNKVEVDKILKSVSIVNLEIKNPRILKRFIKNKVSIGKSSLVLSPCLIKKKNWTIVFPNNFKKMLFPEEIEAVIAHEMEHIVWKDYYFSLVFSFFKSFFWHIPFSFWQKKLERDKEYAADQRAAAEPLYLACALKKFALSSFSKNGAIEAFVQNESVFKRIEALLFLKRNAKQLIFQGSVVLIIATALLFGKIFIF